MTPLGQTPWQTVGPFFHEAVAWKDSADLAGVRESGEVIEIIGQVFDGEGAPVPDALIEIWQADAAGRYDNPDGLFVGYGRAATGEDGAFRLRTILPGSTPGPGNSHQAPHIAVGLFGRGLMKRLATRLYFAGHPLNDRDRVLALVPGERQPTLMATPVSAEPGAWRFDIRLQGGQETVFFDL